MKASDTNVAVIGEFLRRRPLSAGRLYSDGRALWSYWRQVGVWENGRVRVVPASGQEPMTTARHRRMLQEMLRVWSGEEGD